MREEAGGATSGGRGGDPASGEPASGEPAREARLTLEPDTSSVGVARQFLRRTLEAWGSVGITDTATLLASELVTNAILHARCAPELVVRLDDTRLRIEVHDSSPILPARKRYGLYAGTGRGISLVDMLAADWGTTPAPHGKSVWFELDEDTRAEGARLLDPEVLADLADLSEVGPPPSRPARASSEARRSSPPGRSSQAAGAAA